MMPEKELKKKKNKKVVKKKTRNVLTIFNCTIMLAVVHSVVQQISTIFSYCKTETVYALNKTNFPPLPSPWLKKNFFFI